MPCYCEALRNSSYSLYTLSTMGAQANKDKSADINLNIFL